MLSINTILKRREPQGDAYDRLRVVGVFDLGVDWGGEEVVLSPADEFGQNFTAATESIALAYTVENPGDDAEQWQEGPGQVIA